EYEAFAGRDLSEFAIAYFFVDGVAERLHAGLPREAVLCAWGITEDGRKVLLHLAPGTKEDTASCTAFFEDLKRRGLADPLPAVVQCFRDDFDACIAHLRFPLRHRRVVRTTNLLERLFLEERRRTKIIPHAFGERPVLKLMYAAVIRAADRWRGLAVGEFEQRQLRAIRDELDRAHAERMRPAVRHIPSASPSKLSS